MIDFRISPLWVGLIVLVCLAQPTLAFGAGNIGSLSKIEGINWRHGDIEDALLNIAMARCMNGKKFDKIAVSRIYFGNWLRDYSQAVDVGTVKSVSAEAIRLVLSILGFLTFGYGSKEFEVTSDRLGCYRPEEHIDNPKNYADNEDARQYDRRLRGPIDERRELAIDNETGMKAYIASERAGIQTSAELLRRLFGGCIELGRKYSRNKRSEDLYEALRLMGTGLHCLEDFFAHSNYTELALIEMGITEVFPHVGRDTQINLDGARNRVYPLVTGTFGGVDFLHSVTGEVSDKLKQNELQELESALEESKRNDTSVLRDLLDKIPDSFFGGKHQSDKLDEIQQNCANSQMQNMKVSPKEPEEFTRYVQGIFRDIMPIIEWHDDVMKSLSAAFDKIPILPQIIEQLEEQLTKFIFTQIAPFILPVVQQIQNEMSTGSEQIVESSKREQHVVFNDDRSTDPTHSMLSKDHFTNLLNEPAGRTASEMIQWVVPQLMNAIDDENTDVNRTLTRIIYGVFHHPAQRNQGNDGAQEGRQLIFRSIENWWNSMGRQQQDDYRRKLSRDGVEKGENHKEGEYDTGHGHGCLGSLHMHKQFGKKEPKTWEDKIANKAAGAILEGATGALSGIVQQTTGVKIPTYQHPEEKTSKDDGPGGLLGAASSLIGGILGGGRDEKEERPSSSSNYGRQDSSHSGGGYQQQQQQHGGSYGSSQQSYGGRQEEHSGYGGRRDDNRRDDNRRDDNRRDDNRRDDNSSYGGGYGGSQQSYGGGSSGGYGSSQQSYGGRQEEHSGYGGRRDDNSSYGGRREESGGYGGSQQSYGGRQEEHGGYGGRRDDNSSYGGSQSYGGRREESGGYGGRREESGGYGGQQGYGGGSGGYGGGGRRDDRDDRDRDNDRHSGGRRRDDDDDDYKGRYGGSGRRDDRRDDDDNHGGRRW